MNAITNYINQAIAELHQVRWPTRQQAVRLSLIAIGFTLTASVVFGVVDYGLSQLLKLLLSFAV